MSAPAVGVDFVDGVTNLASTTFAYQGIVGAGWNLDDTTRFYLEGRYYGTTNPRLLGTTWNKSNLGLKFWTHAEIWRRGATTAQGRGAVLYGVLRLGPRGSFGPGPQHHPADGQRLQNEGRCADHRDRPHGYVGFGVLQYGAVAAPCEFGQGRL